MLRFISSNSPYLLEVANDLNLGFLGGWYFHGKLQSRLGTDIGTVCNLDKYPWFIKSAQETCISGVYPVEVFGVPESCTGFFWTAQTTSIYHHQRGLIILDNDTEGVKNYVIETYNKKPIFI